MQLFIIRSGSLLERFEQVLDVVRGERRLAKDTHDFKDGSTNLEVMLDNFHQTVCDDSSVYLYSDSIFGFAPEGCDMRCCLIHLKILCKVSHKALNETDV